MSSSDERPPEEIVAEVLEEIDTNEYDVFPSFTQRELAVICYATLWVLMLSHAPGLMKDSDDEAIAVFLEMLMLNVQEVTDKLSLDEAENLKRKMGMASERILALRGVDAAETREAIKRRLKEAGIAIAFDDEPLPTTEDQASVTETFNTTEPEPVDESVVGSIAPDELPPDAKPLDN